MSLNKIKTVVGDLTLNDYLLRNNIEKAIADKLTECYVIVDSLKNELEQFDMNREHGKYPEDYEKYIDKLAGMIWIHGNMAKPTDILNGDDHA